MTPAASASLVPHPAHPSSYPRRALVCLVGLSPQVVTETLYALATSADEPFLPTALHIVTTSVGAQRVHEQLLAEGRLQALVESYFGGQALAFDVGTQLHVVQRDGVPLWDIQSAEDHTALADTVLRLVRGLARDEQCAIHASLAGGRKSMGFYIGYVLSLLGRAQDRLSHVLVEPSQFESRPDFFYPPPEPVLLPGHGTPLSTADARVSLAPVSFVRISAGLHEQLQRDDLDFEGLVRRAQAALSPIRVVLAPGSREVRIEGFDPLVLEPALFVWYLYFCVRRQQRLQEDSGLLAPGMLRVHRHKSRQVGLDAGLMGQICRRVGVDVQPTDLTPAELRTRVSPINKALLQGFGAELGHLLVISGPADRGTRDGQYGLIGLAAEQIHVA